MTYADKRIDRLLKIWELACSDLPDWELVLVGDGPRTCYFTAKAVEMGCPSFVWDTQTKLRVLQSNHGVMLDIHI